MLKIGNIIIFKYLDENRAAVILKITNHGNNKMISIFNLGGKYMDFWFDFTLDSLLKKNKIEIY